MSRHAVGIIGGIAFGSISVAIMLPMEFTDKTAALTAAFVSRFSIGLVIGSARLPLPGWLRGLLFGLLLSLPDAIITNAWIPILSFGAFGGLILGIAVDRFGIERLEPGREEAKAESELPSSQNDMVSDTELSAIDAMCKAASPGPWNERIFNDVAHAVQEGGFRWACSNATKGQQDLFEGEVGVVMIMQVPEKPNDEQGYRVKGIVEVSGPDARFIARARKDLPRLVAEVRRLMRLLTEKSDVPDHSVQPDLLTR